MRKLCLLLLVGFAIFLAQPAEAGKDPKYAGFKELYENTLALLNSKKGGLKAAQYDEIRVELEGYNASMLLKYNSLGRFEYYDFADEVSSKVNDVRARLDGQ